MEVAPLKVALLEAPGVIRDRETVAHHWEHTCYTGIYFYGILPTVLSFEFSYFVIFLIWKLKLSEIYWFTVHVETM